MTDRESENSLYYGDNLDVLRRHVADESVDLVYLDPPFNSNQSYNVLFAEQNGSRAASQIKAFEDTWRWDQAAAAAYYEVVEAGGRVSETMQAFRKILGENDMMAYMAMMAPRVLELRRVMKETSSLYLHCDPTASHYLKILLDGVFGVENYRNEISWRRSNPKSLGKINFANCRDVILRYSKSRDCTFNGIFGAHDPAYVEKAYKHVDDQGRRYRLLPLLNPNDDRPNLTYEFLGVSRVWRWTRERMQKAYEDGSIVQLKPGAVPQYKLYLEESKGRTITNDWNDIPQASGKESLGYPTQKPEALLERIIRASSNEGDLVLDPFCGCGTAVAVAQRLNRRWIGIDITNLAITLIKSRMKDAFGDEARYHVVGEPVSVPDAEALAASDPHQFQWWALGLIGARPVEKRKGADKGIDGRIYFHDEAGGKTKSVVLSVKSGHATVAHVRDLRGVVEREGAAIGVLISMHEPTQPMRSGAAAAGFYDSPGWNRAYPRLQLRTVAELMEGMGIEHPPTNLTFKRAPKANSESPGTPDLFGGGPF
ncbi:MAG: DNA methyltransferase [Candidatus Sumerlaeota bacterium]|nr:DNA methyltransferase [Candidatus Sumerlaeota bacterium]